jgi:hypothetical protein
MQQKSTFFAGLGAAGAALLLSGCGGGSFSKNSFGTYQNAVPAAYGIEGTASNVNISGPLGGPYFYETSGIGSADGKTAYLTAASDFTIVQNPNNATLLTGVDPNGSGKVPLGFSGTIGGTGTAGSYIDANTAAVPAIPLAVAPGASVVFRAAISNGVSSSTQSTVPITYNGVSLSSTDPQWTLGTLPLTFNYLKVGPFANATYGTGTPAQTDQGTLTPFIIPFTTSGIHTVNLTVADDGGQQTTTAFAVPVVTSTNVALLLQNMDTGTKDSKGNAVYQSITAGDTVTIDGGAGIGYYPATGYNFAQGDAAKISRPTIADPQGSVIFFVTPGTYTIVDTTVIPATKTAAATTAVISEIITVPATAAGTTIIDPAITAAAAAIRSRAIVRR